MLKVEASITKKSLEIATFLIHFITFFLPSTSAMTNSPLPSGIGVTKLLVQVYLCFLVLC